MNIEIKHKNLRDTNFNSGLAKLSRFTGFAPKQLYNVSRIVEKVRVADKESERGWVKLIEPFLQKDEAGKVIPEMNEGKPIPNSFAISDDKKEAFTKAIDDFNEASVTIKRYKIPLDDLQGVGLNAQELLALEPLIHGLEIAEGEEQNGQEENEVQAQEKSH